MYVWLSKNVESEGNCQRFYGEKYKINVQCLIFILQVRICDFSPYMWIPCTTFWVESISVKSVSNFFFFQPKYNLNLFPQYLAKSNISNHGFWWPCSLLKLEVYKKKFALYWHLSKEALNKRTQDLWQYLLCIHCNINYSQQRKL